jgi:hypothetical protein
MRRTIRDLILTVVTLGVACGAMIAGASLRMDWLLVAILILWWIGEAHVFNHDD